MAIKIKVLGLGLLAALAMSALTVVNVGATTGGHFTFDSEHPSIQASEGIIFDVLEFSPEDEEGGIVCNSSNYGAYTATSTTSDKIIVQPNYSECHTTGDLPGTTTIDTQSCTWSFPVASGTTSETEQTLTLSCTKTPLTITHPNCTITVFGQTAKNASTYTTITISNKHALTVDVSATFVTHYHAGLCIFLGTSHTIKVKGSLILKGVNTLGEPINLTAT